MGLLRGGALGDRLREVPGTWVGGCSTRCPGQRVLQVGPTHPPLPPNGSNMDAGGGGAAHRFGVMREHGE